MLTDIAFSNLVSRIYDSVVDPERWPVFFDCLNAAGNFNSGALMVIEPDQGTTRFSLSWGVEAGVLRSIEERHANDPTMVFLHALIDPSRDPDEPVVYRRVFDDAFLERSPLYQELSRLTPIADSIALLTLKLPSRLGFLTALRYRPGERYGDREVALMRALAP